MEGLERHILTAEGTAPTDLRAKAFAGQDLPDPLTALLEKVAKQSYQVTDADFARALAAGYTEDQLFELVICAAVGESRRLYSSGLGALNEAST
jgi:hypothetical protein